MKYGVLFEDMIVYFGQMGGGILILGFDNNGKKKKKKKQSIRLFVLEFCVFFYFVVVGILKKVFNVVFVLCYVFQVLYLKMIWKKVEY